MTSDHISEPVFLELGRAIYVFQAIEARIKVLLPHLTRPESGEPPRDEGWNGRHKYLDSKEMLGNLVRLLQERISVEDSSAIEAEWRAVVQGRNDVVHSFVFQTFPRCSTAEEVRQSIEYIRARRARAIPLLRMLDTLLHGLIAALPLPPGFEGEVPVALPDWLNHSAA